MSRRLRQGCIWLVLWAGLCFAEDQKIQLRIDVSKGNKTDLTLIGTQTGYLDNSKPQDIQIALTLLLEEYLVVQDKDVSLTITSDAAFMRDQFNQGKVDSIFGSPLELLGTEKSRIKDMLMVVLIDGKAKRNYKLLVRKDSPIEKLDDLKGKVLSVREYNDIGRLYLERLFQRQFSVYPDQYLTRLDMVERDIEAIHRLFFRQVDAALVTDTSFNVAADFNPQLVQQLRILEQSDDYITSMMIFNKDIPADVLKITINNILNLHKIETGRNLLGLLGGERFVILDDNAIANIAELVDWNAGHAQ